MALEARDPAAIVRDTRHIVEAYNREDVESTFHLRNWLERLRSDRVSNGVSVPRPVAEEEPKNQPSEPAVAIALRERMLAGVAAEASEPTHHDHVRLLAYC